MIFHLALESDFRAGLGAETYQPADLSEVGFVHCADRSSVLPVAGDYFSDASEPLLVLEIDPARLVSELRYEAPAPIAGGGSSHLAGAREFPHIYGPVAREAIVRVGTLASNPEGFEWPSAFLGLAAFLAQR